MRRIIGVGCLAGLAAFLLCGCGISYRNAEVNRFVGQDESMLFKQYGKPWSVANDSKGRKVLTFEVRWQEQVQVEGTSWTDSSGITRYNPPTTRTEQHVEHRIFTIDASGKVIKTSWKMF